MAKVVTVSKCVLATNAALRNLWANFSNMTHSARGQTVVLRDTGPRRTHLRRGMV